MALCAATNGNVKVLVAHNDNGHTNPEFKFDTVPPPSRTDAATQAKFTLADGEPDENGGGLDKLHDGKLPTESDQPAENFFFNAGTPGGRLVIDLGAALELKQVNTYSWHPNTRGPQVYKLYAADGKADGFNPRPGKGLAPEKSGWRFIAKVDTRPKEGQGGGQYGVSISDTDGVLGAFRYLLFDVSVTEADDDFGNTFYSEIDVIPKDGASAAVLPPAQPDQPFLVQSADGYCAISIDASRAPDLKAWAEQKLAPVLAEWYPKLVAMLPSEGYHAPTNFSVILRPGNGVAATGGDRITANSNWLSREVDREALGALVHEEVHVVQRYGGRHRNDPDFKPAPGWLAEGLADYIRWFLFEPQSHGADAVWLRGRRNPSLRYDAGYRMTANFLNYVVEHHDPQRALVTRLNAACRQGQYSAELWHTCTGKTLPELADEWKTDAGKQLSPAGT